MKTKTFAMLCLPAAVLGLFLGSLAAQQVLPQPVQVHPRGRVAPPNLGHLRMLKSLTTPQLPPVCNLPEYDARKDGVIPPLEDQGQCGSCWLFSGKFVVSVAYRKAGLSADSLSAEYFLSCCKSGGCDGDDNTTVLTEAKLHGLPLTDDYGPYLQKPGRCKYNSAMKLLQIKDWGFADGSNQPGYDRPTDTQLIKNAVHAYGAVGCAVAANSSWDNYRGGVHRGPLNPRGIDHDVAIVGWKDDPTMREGGYWIMPNWWGENWGEKGYMRIAYGADSIGTEAVYAYVTNPNPPKPPDPPAPPPEPCKCHVHFLTGGGAALAVLALALFLVWLLKWRKK